MNKNVEIVNPFKPVRLASLLATLLFLAIILAGCGGSGSQSDTLGNAANNTSESGEVVIGLTDAEGDFLTYTVDVLSLTLTRQDGTVIETIPQSTRVDFNQYRELTEFFTSATVPAGRYTDVALTLDYSNADIQVEVNGVAVLATIQNSEGDAVGVVETQVKLEDAKPLVVAPGIPAHLTVDFDLEASTTVDTQVNPPLVVVEPFLLADVNPAEPKPRRLRGLLADVASDTETLKINLRPFHSARGAYGAMTAHVNDETVYEINEEVYTGSEGLQNLALQSLGAPVLVWGVLNLEQRRFNASEVYYGSSVPGAGRDVVTGNVIARNGDVLTVRGATVVRTSGSVVFNDDIEVHISELTKLTKQGQRDAALSKNSVSVGQRISAFGQLAETSPGVFVLDASSGLVRLLLTVLKGDVVSASDATLLLSLQAIDGRRLALFDFTGTGMAGDDADPANYRVDVSTMNVSNYDVNEPVKIRGFVSDFGMSPPDFHAKTVASVAEVKMARLGVNWQPATLAPFVSMGIESLVLNMDGVGRIHHVMRRGVITDLLDLAQAPVIEPDQSRVGRFSIRHAGTVQIFRTFSEFEQSLERRLDGSTALKHLTAKGAFDEDNATMEAYHISVGLR